MEPSDLQVTESERGYFKLLESYIDAVASRLPVRCRHIVDLWSITRTDALALLRFLECYSRDIVVFEIGTFFGVSTFNLAIHPRVLGVVSIDPNPSLAELHELRYMPDAGPSLREVGVMDLAAAALGEFPEQQRKIRLQLGTTESVGVPVSLNGGSLVAFVDGEHSKEAVAADLRAIFDKDSAAVAILHDYRGHHGPAILAGIASFLQDSSREYHFRLFEYTNPNPGPLPPNLCVVYPSAVAEEIEQAASGLLASPESSLIQAAFEGWQDWKWQREQVGRWYDRAQEQQKRGDRLEERLQELIEEQHRQRQERRRLRRRAVRLEHQLESMQASRVWKLARVLGRLKAKALSLAGRGLDEPGHEKRASHR